MAGPVAIGLGAVMAIATAALLASRAGNEEQVVRAVRVGWVIWLAALAGIAEERQESRQLIVHVSIVERLIHRWVLASVLSLVVATGCLIAVMSQTDLPHPSRLVGEMLATHLAMVGISSLIRIWAPPGLVAVITLPIFVLLIITDLVIPRSLRVWPSPAIDAYRALPSAWLLLGCGLLLGGLLAAARQDRTPAAWPHAR
jgi:hypothetical protein